MVEYSDLAAIIVTLLNAAIAIINKKMHKKFRDANALNVESAISIKELNPIYSWRIKRMNKSEFVYNAETQKCYLDDEIYAKRRSRRLIIALSAIILVIILLSISFLSN